MSEPAFPCLFQLLIIINGIPDAIHYLKETVIFVTSEHPSAQPAPYGFHLRKIAFWALLGIMAMMEI